MLQVEASTLIQAPPAAVAALYADFRRWPEMFPTIRAVRLLADDQGTRTIEVDHREGRVINRLTIVSRRRIRLEEFKRRFDGIFINDFEPAGAATRYRVTASIRLKGAAVLLQPFLAGHVRRTIRRYVLEPVRRAAEKP